MHSSIYKTVFFNVSDQFHIAYNTKRKSIHNLLNLVFYTLNYTILSKRSPGGFTIVACHVSQTPLVRRNECTLVVPASSTPRRIPPPSLSPLNIVCCTNFSARHMTARTNSTAHSLPAPLILCCPWWPRMTNHGVSARRQHYRPWRWHWTPWRDVV